MELEALLSECRSRIASAGRFLVAHHWDADGVASAALILRHAPGSGRPEPVRIGFYSADAVPRPLEGETLIVVDYGIPGPEYDRLNAATRLHLVLDHHRVPPPREFRGYCNPVSLGLASEAEYPGASVLVYQALGAPGDRESKALAALGGVGDLAPYIDSGTPHPGLGVVERLLEGTGYSTLQLRRIAELVDSAYRILDHECLASAARAGAREGVEGLAGLHCLMEAYEKSKKLILEAQAGLEGPEDLPGGVRAYKLVLDAHVTSALGRRLAAENPESIVALLHVIPSQRVARLYVRSVKSSLHSMRETLSTMGLKVAGKESVIVVEVPAERAEWLEEALREAASRLSGTRRIRPDKART